jgi:hypothetical protein
MEVKLLNADFTLSAVIDTPRVLRYSECFYDSGSLYMEVGFEKSIYEKLKPPCRILVGDLIYNVERRWFVDDIIRVYGVGIFDEFKHKSILMGEELTARPSEILNHYAQKMVFEGVDYEVLSLQSDDERVYSGVEWCESLYDIITRLCFEYSIGFRIVYSFDLGKIRFHILDARDRASNEASELTFISDRMDTYTDIETDFDITNYKNKLELIWKINSLHEVKTFVFDRVPNGEAERTLTDYKHIVGQTETELRNLFYARARELFKTYRKKHQYKVKLRQDPKHRVGDICYVESTALGEKDYALLTVREVEITDTYATETLTLEVEYGS